MKISAEALRIKLTGELDVGAVEYAPASLAVHAVDGKIPSLLCLPATAEEVAASLRVCSEAGAAVVPWGGGTSMRLGNIPRRVDVVLGLERLDKLIEHDDANLTATVQAGMRLASLQEILGRRRQFLPLDPPHPERATVGGTVAANVNGPRRMMHGGVRDLVVGMKMVLGTGERVKSGGKVVKNVAGYDLGKLFIGSLGTLGIVTEATFRMAPLPETQASFVASGPLDRCGQFVAELWRSPLLPAAVTIFSPGSIDAPGLEFQTPAAAVRLEGFEEAVARHLHDLEATARRAGVAGQTFRAESHQRLWGAIRDFAAGDTGVLCRLTVPAGSVPGILAGLTSEAEKQALYAADAATGTIYASIRVGVDGMKWLAKLAVMAGSQGGHAVIAAAPADLKQGIDVWGPAPASLSLMRDIKRQFDPENILNPGRFLAGL